MRVEGGHERRVVKHFHARGLLGVFTNLRRALRERRNLLALAARGMPVPGVLALERHGADWCVVMDFVRGAHTLGEVLTGEANGPLPRRELARRLGDLLGRAHGAGVRQIDLHAGNVLIDERGELWMIDVAHVRFGAVSAERAREDLVRACAFLRETTATGFRARALVAWRRAAPAELRRVADARSVPALEQDGRAARVHALSENADRWTRPSGQMRRAKIDGREWLVRRARHADGPGTPVFEDLAPRARLQAFARLGRLFEHGLPVARPARLASAHPWSAEVDGLDGFEPSIALAPSLAPRALRRAARELGFLCGSLRERGYGPSALGPAAVLVARTGALQLAPSFVPTACEPRVTSRCDFDALVLATPRLRALFAAGFARALGGARSERAAWLEELLQR